MVCPDCPYSQCIGAGCRLLSVDVTLALKETRRLKLAVPGLLNVPVVESGNVVLESKRGRLM